MPHEIGARGFFQRLTNLIKARLREDDTIQSHVFVEYRTPCRFNKGHRTEKVQDGKWDKNSGTNKKGDPKMKAKPCPFLDFTNLDAEGNPKPMVVHVCRTHARIMFDYQKLVQDAQGRAGKEKDFKAGEPVWDWKSFQYDGTSLPFIFKVYRDPVTHVEVEVPNTKKQVYLYMLPNNYIRDGKDRTVRLDEEGEPVSLRGNVSWYEDIVTGERIDYKILEHYLPPKQDKKKIADRQGHGNELDVVNPLTITLANVRYMSVMGERFHIKARNMGPIIATDMDSLVVTSEAASEDETKDMPAVPMGKAIGKTATTATTDASKLDERPTKA